MVCIIYAVAASLWILLSDKLLAYLTGPEMFVMMQSWKGLLFVLISSVLLYVLLERKNGSILSLFYEIRNQMQYFQATFEQAAVGIVHISEDEKWIRVNKKVCDILEYTYHEFKTLALQDIVHPDDLKSGRKMDHKILNGDLDSYVMEKRYIAKSGRTVPTRLTKSAVRDTGGQLLYMIAIIEEISAQKKAEKKLKKSLEEKGKLLAEIHHRVKNNLAVISGLMELQALYTNSNATRQILKKSMLRIKSMALIHESYYESQKLSYVTVSDYLKDFSGFIENYYSDINGSIHFNVESSPIQMNINQAIPCGLLLTELIISYYSEEIHDVEDAEINVSLHQTGDTSVMLQVKSQLQSHVSATPEETEDSDTLTTTIVNALIRQLEAEMDIVHNVEGSSFTVTFNLEKQKKGSSNAYFNRIN